MVYHRKLFLLTCINLAQLKIVTAVQSLQPRQNVSPSVKFWSTFIIKMNDSEATATSLIKNIEFINLSGNGKLS